MKRFLATICLTGTLAVVAGTGSAKALAYVCYWTGDMTRSAYLSQNTLQQWSTVTYQLGESCTGQPVVLKTKRVDITVVFSNSFSWVQHTVNGIYLAKNGYAYWSSQKSQSCTAPSGSSCTVSMTWLPYVSTNYDGYAYNVNGSMSGVGGGISGSWSHRYLPSSNYLTWAWVTGGCQPPDCSN